MDKNDERQRAVRSRLDNIIDVLGITDSETEMPPISDEERALVKLQLLYAQILAKDILEIKKYNNEWSNKKIMETLLSSWIENVKSFTKEILKDSRFKLNVVELLRDFNKKY